jgi:hypothetical protein
MNHANHTTLSNQIDKAAALAEIIHSRTEQHSVNRILADTLLDMLLTMTSQIDEAMSTTSMPHASTLERLSNAEGH